MTQELFEKVVYVLIKYHLFTLVDTMRFARCWGQEQGEEIPKEWIESAYQKAITKEYEKK